MISKRAGGLRIASWLAFRELTSRKARFVTSIALVAVAVSLCIATELLSRSREVALAAEIDGIGPSIQMIPSGLLQTDLTRLDLNGRVLEPELKADLERHFSQWIRAVEARLIFSSQVGGIITPIIAHDAIHSSLATGGIALGAVAATRLQKQVGDKVTLLNTEYPVTAVLPSMGTAEDLALFIHRDKLKRNAVSENNVNELRLYLFPESDGKQLGRLLRERYPSTNTIINDRGSVADRESGDSLRRHRFVVYAITSIIVAISLLISTFLNAKERIGEMATLVAVGGTRLTVFYAFTMRALIVSTLGSITGYCLGVSVALAQQIGGAFLLVGSWNLLIIATLATATLSLIAVAPVSLLAGLRSSS